MAVARTRSSPFARALLGVAAAFAPAGAPPAARADDPPQRTAPAPAKAGAEPASEPTSEPTAEPVSAFFFTTNAKVKHSIDLADVKKGILRANPKDGIPAIRRPAAVPAAEADWVKDDDRVIGVVLGEEARAYPILQMQRHEVVDDVLGAVPIAVTYCPLCDSAVAFRRTLGEGKGSRILTFGISGFLHQSDVLLYDAETETFWQQYDATAVVGPQTGTTLPAVPLSTTTWKAWRAERPDTTVLSWRTEHRWPKAAYADDAYADYHRAKSILFPVSRLDDRLRAKTLVHGVAVEGHAVAVPDATLRAAKEPLRVDAGAVAVRFHPADAGGAVRAERLVASKEGERWEDVPVLRSYWFAWATFHAGTAVAGVPASVPADAAGPAAMDGGS